MVEYRIDIKITCDDEDCRYYQEARIPYRTDLDLREINEAVESTKSVLINRHGWRLVNGFLLCHICSNKQKGA